MSKGVNLRASSIDRFIEIFSIKITHKLLLYDFGKFMKFDLNLILEILNIYLSR